jgi:histidinol-phosphate/aromatic aminotransferase/cobyric acid decarboxylase-like protein
VVAWTEAAGIDGLDVLVLVHPNNPTGARYGRERLLDWHADFAARGGWLVVDEAFIDPTPEASLVPSCGPEGLIVLRSLGKFFGLPGARVGFVAGAPDLLADLAEVLGPWPVAGPSRWLARQALKDDAWQAAERMRVAAAGERLARLLAGHDLQPSGTALFQWVQTPAAPALHRRLAGLGILTRLFEAPASLRFGLPGPEADWRRLAAALAEVTT